MLIKSFFPPSRNLDSHSTAFGHSVALTTALGDLRTLGVDDRNDHDVTMCIHRKQLLSGNSTTSRTTNNNLIDAFRFSLKDMMSMWRRHKYRRHKDEDACMSKEELKNHVYRLICSHEQKWNFRIRTIYRIRGTLSSW